MASRRNFFTLDNDANMVVGPRGQRVIHDQFTRHGSDERGTSSRRRQRSRDRPDTQRGSSLPTGGIRSGPAGVQERIEWMDALQECDRRITQLEQSNRNLAQSFAHTEQVTRDHTGRLQVIGQDIPAYKA